MAFLPNSFRDNTVSGFVQDEIALIPGTLSLVVGTKLERDSFMRTPQLQPSAQMLWTPNQVHTFWTSVARAVRAPSRNDTGFQLALDAFPLPYGGWITPVLISDPHFQPEKLTAYEAGYRLQRQRLSLDVSTFVNRYDQLRSVENFIFPSGPIVVARPPVIPLTFANNQYGNGLGYEANVGYELNKRVRLLADYSYLQLDLANRLVRDDPSTTIGEGEAPKHQGEPPRTGISTTVSLWITRYILSTGCRARPYPATCLWYRTSACRSRSGLRRTLPATTCSIAGIWSSPLPWTALDASPGSLAACSGPAFDGSSKKAA